jgi:alpha-D-xyloside xylohydrolase
MLTPYILQEALKGHGTGTPLMRPLFLEFPEDLNTYAIDTQYMFGPNLLVAPVFTEEGEVTFYVPQSPDDEAGEWISWFDHSKSYESGRWYTETHGFDTMPILIRPGSVTVTNPTIKGPEDDALSGIELLINGRLRAETTVEIVNSAQSDEILKTVRVAPTEDGKVEASGHSVKLVYVA